MSISFSKSIKSQEYIFNFSSYLYYILPFFIGLGAFVPNAIYTILFFIFVFVILIKHLDLSYFNNNLFKLLLLFWAISVISSFFSENKTVSLISSVSFLRFVAFSLFTYWLISKKLINYKIFYYILLISLTIVLFFSYFEFLTGYNVILDNLTEIIEKGFKDPNTRISGLFGDEQVLGGYLLRISLFSIIIYFLSENKVSKNFKAYFIFIIFSCILFIILSGERSSILMLVFSIFLFLILINGYKKIKILFLFSFFIIFLSIITFKPDMYNRIIQQTFKLQLYSVQNNSFHLFSSTHEAHFKTAINIFLKNPLLGSGNKSFRFLCDQNKYDYNIQKIEEGDRKGQSVGCANHPHNYYLQVLAENGLLNFFLLILFYIFLIKKLYFHFIKKYFKKRENLSNSDVSIYIFFIILMWPIIPTGSFFSSWIASTIFLPMGLLINSYKANNE